MTKPYQLKILMMKIRYDGGSAGSLHQSYMVYCFGNHHMPLSPAINLFSHLGVRTCSVAAKQQQKESRNISIN